MSISDMLTNSLFSLSFSVSLVVCLLTVLMFPFLFFPSFHTVDFSYTPVSNPVYSLNPNICPIYFPHFSLFGCYVNPHRCALHTTLRLLPPHSSCNTPSVAPLSAPASCEGLLLQDNAVSAEIRALLSSYYSDR